MTVPSKQSKNGLETSVIEKSNHFTHDRNIYEWDGMTDKSSPNEKHKFNTYADKAIYLLIFYGLFYTKMTYNKFFFHSLEELRLMTKEDIIHEPKSVNENDRKISTKKRDHEKIKSKKSKKISTKKRDHEKIKSKKSKKISTKKREHQKKEHQKKRTSKKRT